jgi:hypothetical protein
MSYIYRSVEIGRSATPTADLMKVNTIRGRALAKGDAADTTGTATNTASNNQYVGWIDTTPQVRAEPIAILPHSSLVTYVPVNARILSATLKLSVIGRFGWGGVVPGSGTNFVQVWPVRRAVNASFTGLTWVNWFTASPWAEYGIKFGIGADSDSTYLDRFEFTQADYDLNPSAATPIVKDVDLTTEIQRVIDFTEPLQLAFKAEWAKPSSGSGYVILSQPSGDAANPHSYLEINYRRPREFYQAAADGTLDQTEMLDATSESLNQHLWLGAVAKGSASSYEKFYIRNEMTSTQPAVTIVSGRATIGSIDNSAVVGSGTFQCIRVYDYVASTSATPTGVWRFVFTSATLYDVKFTPDGTTTESTVVTGKSINSDETIQYSSVNALHVKSQANGGSTGTFAAADVVTFETRADLHTTAYPKANLDDFYLAPHANNDRTTANSAVKRSAANAFATQLNLNDGRTVANSGGSTAVCCTVTDGGTFTHIKVPDPMIFATDGYATLATYNSLGDPAVPGSGERVETVQIKARYDINDATYPGQIRLYENLSTPADFDSTSIFTSGLWIGMLEEADQQTLSADASTASPVISLTAALTATSGVLTLLDIDTGTNEQRTIASVVGSTVTLTAVPSYAYPRGSLVFFASETASNRPFFCQTTVPAAATKGRKRAYVTSESWAVI